MKNYYHLLNVPRNASVDDVKAAYRKLSVKLHPDQNQGDKFFEKFFKEIKDAYDCLVDVVKRQRYDWDLDNFVKQRGELKNEDLFQSHEALLKKERELFRHRERELKYAAKELQEQFSNFVHKTERENKQQEKRVEELQGDIKNLWKVLAFSMIISLGFGLFLFVKSMQRTLPPTEKQGRVVAESQWDSLLQQSASQAFWKKIATDTLKFQDAFSNISGKQIAQIVFLNNSSELEKKAKFDLAALAEYLKGKEITKVYLKAYCHTDEPDFIKLPIKRGRAVLQELVKLGVKEERLVIDEMVEMAAIGGTFPTKKNAAEGRVLVVIPD